MKGNYLLFDFWGTWCDPCRETTPYLKNLYASTKDKNLKIIGIAYDRSLQSVRSYLHNEKIGWINLFDERDSHGICEKFMVQAFPTFILVAPNGKIVLRGSGKDYFSTIQRYLAEHLK